MKQSEVRIEVRIQARRENLSTDTATNATANLDCVPADKKSPQTMAKRKVTEEHFKITILRKRAAFLSESPPVANVQKGMDNINPDAGSLPKTGIAFSPTALSRTKIFPNKSQKHSPLTQPRLKIQHETSTHNSPKHKTSTLLRYIYTETQITLNFWMPLKISIKTHIKSSQPQTN